MIAQETEHRQQRLNIVPFRSTAFTAKIIIIIIIIIMTEYY